MKLSKNFTLNEMTKSQTATRRGIANVPGPEERKALSLLAKKVLQVIRDAKGPIRVSSGYRNQILNSMLGGSANSQHIKGEAADIEAYDPKISNIKLAQWIVEFLPEWDQLILEYLGDKPDDGWIHISYSSGNNRNEILRKGIGGQYVKLTKEDVLNATK